MARHIGIVGCSIDGAALCYRSVCQEIAAGSSRNAPHEVSVHNMPWANYQEHLRKSDWKAIAKLMLASTKKLVKGGAELIICPDSTVHEAFEAVSRESPRPWLHIAEIVVQEAVAKKYCRLGLLGTKRLMNGSVYGRVLQRYGLELELPGEQDQESIDKIIHEELRQGIVSDSSRRSAADIVDQLKQRGCDAVILGCAELPLLITPQDSSLPTLDSAHLLAKGAVRASLRSINDEVFYPHLFLWGRIRIP